jgi:uncharacterized protein YecA (UPF0149 family)
MLSSNNIKNFIVNPDVYLGSAAVRYFDDSLSEDEEILNIALDRCASISEDEQLLLLGEVTNLKLNSESINKIITLLHNVSPKLRFMYGRLLANADSALLASANFDMKLLMPEIRIILNQRLQLPTYSTDELLKELLDLSVKNADKYANEFDYKYGELIVEELAKRDDLDENKIIKTLTDTEFTEYGYYESYLLTLAGKRKLETLVPLFIDGLGESDLVSEEAMYSLMRLGTADIIQKLVEKYPNEDEDFKIYASGVFENVKIIESEKAALKLLKEETNITLKTLLAGALCQLFSADAIPQIKELIQEGYDESMLNLEELAYINCIFNGLNIPEMELWKEGFDKEKDFFTSPPELNLPVISEIKVGRNDPCPCGSGKKYKKCCG